MGLTASALDRAAGCSASWQLPATHTTSPAASDGHTLHAWVATSDPATVLPSHLRARGQSLLGARSIVARHGLTAEVPMVVGSDGACAVFASDATRRYGDVPGAVWGTADFAGEDDDGWHVVEIKTGGEPVAPARKNWQVRYYVAVGMLATGATRGRGHLWHAQPRGDDHADEVYTVVDMDSLEAEATVRSVIEIAGRAPTVRPGPHCRHCPAVRACPAVGEWIGRLAHQATPDTTRGNAGELFAIVTALRAWSGEVMRALYAMASEEPIATDAGVLRVATSTQERVRPGAYQAIVEIDPRATNVLAPVVPEISKSKIREVAAYLAQLDGGTIAGRERALLDELRARGLITESVSTRLMLELPR